MKLRDVLIGATVAALLVGGGTAIAQQGSDACDGIEPEEGKGPVQGLVWATTVRTDPNGSTKSLELPTLYWDGEAWQCVVAIDASPQGKWVSAQVGDSWVIRLEREG